MPIILRKCGKEVFKMSFFEQHAHYNDEKFDDDRDTIIKEAYNSGVKTIINAGYSLESSKKAIELSEKYDYIYATCGISPNDIPTNNDELQTQLEKVEKLADLLMIGLNEDEKKMVFEEFETIDQNINKIND